MAFASSAFTGFRPFFGKAANSERPTRPSSSSTAASDVAWLSPTARKLLSGPTGLTSNLPSPMIYPVETFSHEERALLAPHFTNLDLPVFALVNLPETVKGALFARYSRYGGTLRRLFLDEFAAGPRGRRASHLRRRRGRARRGPLPADLPRLRRRLGGPARRRPRGLRVGLERDDQGAPARPRWPPTSSSPRATSPTTRRCPGGGYRYWRDEDARARVRRGDGRALRHYSARCRAWRPGPTERFPRADGEPEAPTRRSIKAKALDLLRGLLPAASLSHMGIFATGQAYEQLLLRLHRLAAARGARLRRG